MGSFFRQLHAESMKLRRSAALRAVWLLPLLFLLVEFLIIERPLLTVRQLTPDLHAKYASLQPKVVVALWGGFFHPLMLALLPALVFRPEHRFKTWRHLHAMPLSRRGFFLAKAVLVLLMMAALLGLIGALLFAERVALGWVNPVLAQPFQALWLAKILGSLWLSSLPVLALYLWVSDRINSLAVPVVLGLVGLLLTISLTGQELPQPWKRDLIPWVLPYAATEPLIHEGPAQQEAHMAVSTFKEEFGQLRLPSGKKIKVYQNAPIEAIFPPPPPTPAWLLASFSIGAGMVLLGLGWLDAGRHRT